MGASKSRPLWKNAWVPNQRAFTALSARHVGGGLLLLGFADNRGSDDLNQRLSERRAEVVQGQFRQIGYEFVD